MEEEVTNTESIKDAIEAGNKEIEDVKIQYADEIDELIKKTLTEKDIENFTIPELSDEQLKEVEATEDDIKVYKIARELEYDKEDKLDVENYIDKDFLNKILSDELNISDIKEREALLISRLHDCGRSWNGEYPSEEDVRMILKY